MLDKSKLKSYYMPTQAKIIEIIEESPSVRTFKLKPFKDKLIRDFTPGQFIELSVYGYGEAPFAISSPRKDLPVIEVTVKIVGRVTKALFNLGEGKVVGIRGPYGNGFPLEVIRGRDIIIVSGGTGLSPLRPLLWEICDNRETYGEVVLLYGAKNPSELLFKRDYEHWKRKMHMELTVDVPDEKWRGNVGVVTKLISREVLPSRDSIAIVCGPPIMMKYAVLKLNEIGVNNNCIYVSLERLMQCGVGKCGHCMLSNGKYVCIDGPIFKLSEIPLREVGL